MADFYQNGVITTLHNLVDRPVEDMERELMSFSRTRPMSLVLPSLYSELATDALDNIVEELTQVPYLNEIIIGLDRADREQYAYAVEYFSKLPQEHVVIWNDSPRQKAIGARLEAMGLNPAEPGKGKNVWSCMGYLMACQDSAVMAIHDCDIVTYSADMLARLVYPLANPNFAYQLAKGFYPRVGSGKLNGRPLANTSCSAKTS